MVFVKKWPFFHGFFFMQYRPEKCVLQRSRTKIKPFYPIKTTRSKSRKIEIFSKGLTHVFGQNMAIFPCILFRQYRPRKCVLQSSRTKKRLSRL